MVTMIIQSSVSRIELCSWQVHNCSISFESAIQIPHLEQSEWDNEIVHEWHIVKVHVVLYVFIVCLCNLMFLIRFAIFSCTCMNQINTWLIEHSPLDIYVHFSALWNSGKVLKEWLKPKLWNILALYNVHVLYDVQLPGTIFYMFWCLQELQQWYVGPIGHVTLVVINLYPITQSSYWTGNRLSLVWYKNLDSLVQDCSIPIANALRILQSCTKPWIYLHQWWFNFIVALE